MGCPAENREWGFTLIELLIAMALALVIITAMSTAFISQRKTYAVQEHVSEMIQNARTAMDMISREVKMGGFAPTGYDKTYEGGGAQAASPPPLMQRKSTAASRFVGIPYSTTQLQIIADLNGDGETDGTASNDDTNEEIIYTYDSTNKQIDRNTGGGAQPLAENIQSFTFQYYDHLGNTTTTVKDIRSIEIVITARTAAPDPDYATNSGYRTYILTSYITPPNLDL